MDRTLITKLRIAAKKYGDARDHAGRQLVRGATKDCGITDCIQAWETLESILTQMERDG